MNAIDDEYINLNELIKDMGIKQVLVHSKVWEAYLSQSHKISIIRSLDILKSLLTELTNKLPVRFTVDLGSENANLTADYRMSSKSILIRFDGERNE